LKRGPLLKVSSWRRGVWASASPSRPTPSQASRKVALRPRPSAAAGPQSLPSDAGHSGRPSPSAAPAGRVPSPRPPPPPWRKRPRSPTPGLPAYLFS
jgi:hypothetical protein